jgi:hypothetical protein
MSIAAEPSSPAPPPSAGAREPIVDFLRAGSLLVVVVWHWVFSIVVWRPDGPHAHNPIATTSGLWLLTWLLQVMPVFFFVGGYANAAAWRSTVDRGGGVRQYLTRRLTRLALPAGIAVAIAVVVLVAVQFAFPEVSWATRGVVLVMSPLWFLGVYVVLVAATPAAWRAHRRWGELVLVTAVGVAVWVDLARFRFGHDGAAWLNMVVVWGLVHQAGFFLEQVRDAPVRLRASLALGGFIGLTGLTNMNLYPRSMVGVPGEAFSNMGPPTLCIVALAAFQVGVVTLGWDRLRAALARPGVSRVASWVQANAMTLFLWHLPGYAMAYAGLRLAGWHVPEATTWDWWAQRPLWLVAPAVATAPLLIVMRRVERR